MFACAVAKYVELELNQTSTGKRLTLPAPVSSLFLTLVREAEKPSRVTGACSPRGSTAGAQLPPCAQPRAPAPAPVVDSALTRPATSQRWATRCVRARPSSSRTW